MRRRTLCFCLTLLCWSAVITHADNWPQFRGPHGQGISTETNLPIKWDAQTNVRWKTALPGPGHASPVVWGKRVFVTAYEKPVTKQARGRLLVLCLDKDSGRILWRRDVRATQIEAVHETNSPASSTPVTDGERVIVWFNSRGLLCFDFAGKLLWEKPLGPFPIEWGSGSSPILSGDLVLLNCDTDVEDFLLAVNKRTGQTVWRTARGNLERGWPTPLIWREQIVVSGAGHVKAYEPRTGREVWRVAGLPKWVGPTPVIGNDLLYVTANGLDPDNFMLAIRPGGQGDVTQSHVAWRYDKNTNSIPSPIVVGEYFYTVKNGGMLFCLNARTGVLLWRQRLPAPGDYYASPVAAGGRIYFLSEAGTTTVVAAQGIYEQLSVNALGERCMASPALSDGRIFIRSDQHLYCIGSQ